MIAIEGYRQRGRLGGGGEMIMAVLCLGPGGGDYKEIGQQLMAV